MSLFIDKQNRRKSPSALGVFSMTLMELLLFLVTYAFLLPPVSRAVVFQSGAAAWAVQSLIVSAAGTALSCLFFLVPDKRLVPGGFVGLGVVLCMFCAAALMLERPEDRDFMLRLIFAFGLPPVLVGNAVAWPLYFKMKRSAPAPKRRKTIQQELLEAAEERNVRIPEDVSLLGYDNISFAALPRIDLTTVSQRKFRAGEIAVTRLLEQIRGKKERTVDLLLPELIVRSTCIKKEGGGSQ